MKKIFALCLCVSVVFLMLCGCDDLRQETKDEFNGEYKIAGDGMVGDTEILKDISNIDVSWGSGEVYVKYYDGNTVNFKEESKENLDDSDKLRYAAEAGTLTIKHKASGVKSLISNKSKTLYIYLPNDFVGNNIDISTSSADVYTEMLSVNELEIETSSGKIDANVNKANSLDLSSSSGNIKATADTLVSADFESSSGKVDFTLNETLNELSIETSSGAVNLKLPEALGFKLEKDTASGEFESDFPFVMQEDCYVHATPNAEIEIETSSGDIGVYIK